MYVRYYTEIKNNDKYIHIHIYSLYVVGVVRVVIQF